MKKGSNKKPDEKDKDSIETQDVGASPRRRVSASESKLKEILIVCDGSSLGNGRENPRAACVALLNYKENWKAFGEYLGNATNQQAEIAAAYVGLNALKEPCKVKVLSDSRYVVETMKGNFKRKANHDWWAKLDAAAKLHRISWEWVKGHAGHEVQEAVDEAAREIALKGEAESEILENAVAKVSKQ